MAEPPPPAERPPPTPWAVMGGGSRGGPPGGAGPWPAWATQAGAGKRGRGDEREGWGPRLSPVQPAKRRRCKRRAGRALLAELMQTAQDLTDNAYAPSSQRVVGTALRAWGEFEGAYADERPRMLMPPRYFGDIEASLHNELSCCLFAAWLHDHGLAPATVTTYVSLAKTNLALAVGFTLTVKDLELRLPRMLKGLRRLTKHVRKRRLGWRARYEREIQRVLGEPVGREAWTQKAVRCGMRQGLLRAADSVPEAAAKYALVRHSSLGDLEFFESPKRLRGMS